MNLTLIIFVLLLLAVVYLLRSGGENLFGTPAFRTNVYTNTPNYRGSTLSTIAQMWWQPVAYILNPSSSM